MAAEAPAQVTTAIEASSVAEPSSSSHRELDLEQPAKTLILEGESALCHVSVFYCTIKLVNKSTSQSTSQH